MTGPLKSILSLFINFTSQIKTTLYHIHAKYWRGNLYLDRMVLELWMKVRLKLVSYIWYDVGRVPRSKFISSIRTSMSYIIVAPCSYKEWSVSVSVVSTFAVELTPINNISDSRLVNLGIDHDDEIMIKNESFRVPFSFHYTSSFFINDFANHAPYIATTAEILLYLECNHKK